MKIMQTMIRDLNDNEDKTLAVRKTMTITKIYLQQRHG